MGLLNKPTGQEHHWNSSSVWVHDHAEIKNMQLGWKSKRLMQIQQDCGEVINRGIQIW